MKELFLGPTKDYQGILARLALTTGLGVLGCELLLGWQLPATQPFFELVTTRARVLDFDVPLVALVIAVALSGLSRMIRFNDRLSELFRITKRFELHYILQPLALRSQAIIEPKKFTHLESEREELMQKLFYDEVRKIDQHYVRTAFERWGWYWMLLELIPVALITALILLMTSKFAAAALLLAGCLLGIGLMEIVKADCAGNALREVRLITDDDGRRESIRKTLSAL